MKANGQGFHPLFEKNYVGQFFTLFLDTFLKKNIFWGVGSGTLWDTFAQNIPSGMIFPVQKKIPVACLTLDLPWEKPKPTFQPVSLWWVKAIEGGHLKASPLTPTGPQNNLNFPQICSKMPQNGPKMSKNDPK